MNGVVFLVDDAWIWNFKMASGSTDHNATIVTLGLGTNRVCVQLPAIAELCRLLCQLLELFPSTITCIVSLYCKKSLKNAQGFNHNYKAALGVQEGSQIPQYSLGSSTTRRLKKFVQGLLTSPLNSTMFLSSHFLSFSMFGMYRQEFSNISHPFAFYLCSL